MNKKVSALITFMGSSALLLSQSVIAQEQGEKVGEKEAQDMSDPLAVYTQAGMGLTNKGINIKIGQAYDTGNPKTAGQNILELIGGGGEALGWDGSSVRDNAFDSIRFRNFSVNLTNGRGAQLDVNMAFDKTAMADKSGTASYSVIQSLPKVWRFNFYPLAGAGLNFGENVVDDPLTAEVDEGYSINGSFALAGLYSKLAITDKFWLNYNPFWFTTLGGSDFYKDNAYGPGEGDILTHEFAASYKFSPVFNVRFFANWNEEVDVMDGDHRIEFNYQL